MGASPQTAPASVPVTGVRPAESILSEALEGCRRFVARRALLARLMVVAALVTLVPLLTVVADHHWAGGLGRSLLRTILALWLVGGALAIVAVIVAQRRTHFNALFVGRCLEQFSGIRHNSIVNALFLRQSGQAVYAEEAVLRQAARDLVAPPPEEVAAPPRSWWPHITLLATGIVWLAYLVGSSKAIGPSLARFFGADVAAPTATRLELVHPGPDDVVHIGESLEIEIAVLGKPVAEVEFEIRRADAEGGTGRSFTLPPTAGDGPDRRRLVLAPFEVQGDIHYRCTGGDARLEGVIPVQPQPDVVGTEIVLDPPAYTGWPRQTLGAGDLDVLAGTQATFMLTANTALADPVFVYQGEHETRTRMAITAGTLEAASVTVRLTQTGAYRIEFSDRWGYAYRNPPQRRVTVRVDQPPSVRIVLPAEGQVPGDEVDVAQFPDCEAMAEDDVGVAGLAFVLQRGDAVSRQDAPIVGAAGGTRVKGRVRLADLPIEPGRLAQGWFEASDGRVLLDGRSGPQVARSRVLTLKRAARSTPPESQPQKAGAQDEAAKAETGRKDGSRGQKQVRGSNSSNGGKSREAAGEAEKPGDDQSTTQPASGPGTPEGGQQGSASRPTTSEAPAGPNGDGANRANGDKGESGSDGEFEGELGRFIREHGTEAEEASRAARGGSAQSQPASAPAGRAPESQPTQDKPGRTPSTQPASQPTTNPTSQSTTGPSATRQGSSTDGSATSQPQSEGENPGASSQPASGPSATQPSGGDAPQGGEKQTSDGGGDTKSDPRRPVGENGRPGGAGSIPGGGGSGVGGDQGVEIPERPLDSQPVTQPVEEPPVAPGPDFQEPTGLTETFNLLDMLERGEPITEDMLTDAGWPPEKAAAFVRALERLHVAAGEGGLASALRRLHHDTRVGRVQRQAGQGVAADVQRDIEPASARDDGVSRIAAPAEQSVPESLAELLDAYYRSLAAQRQREGRETPEKR